MKESPLVKSVSCRLLIHIHRGSQSIALLILFAAGSSSRRECNYLVPAYRFVPPVPRPSTRQRPSSVQPSLPLSPEGIKPNQQELQFFDLFSRHTVKQVGGSFNHSFWTVDVLRAARAYPAVWHACLSFAALNHRSKKLHASEDDRKSWYSFALVQHNASIRQMVRIAEQTDPSYADQEAFMLVGMLYTGLCCLQGEMGQGAEHARSSLLLFYQWKFWEHGVQRRAGHMLSPAALISLISLYESQIFSRSRDVKKQSWYLESPPLASPDEPYRSISEAYVDIQPMLTAVFRLFPMIRPQDDPVRSNTYSAIQAELQDRFSTWGTKFGAFLAKQPEGFTATHGALHLELMAIAVNVSLKLNHDLGEVAFDPFSDSFARINDIARQLIALDREAQAKHGIEGHGFSYTFPVSELLYGVGRTCRDRMIRREAVVLLRQWPRRDGVYHPAMVAAMCHVVIELEEAAWYGGVSIVPDECSCVYEKFLCNNHRAGRIDMQMSPTGQVSVQFRSVSDLGHEREGRLQALSLGGPPQPGAKK